MAYSQRDKLGVILAFAAISVLAISSRLITSPPYWAFLGLSVLFLLAWANVVFKKRVLIPAALLLLFAATLRSLYLTPDPILIGYDAYNELLALENTMADHKWTFNKSASYIASYPILYVFSTVIAEVFGWGSMTTAKYSSWLYVFLPGLFIYILCRNRTSNSTAFLLWLPFAVLYTHVFLHTNIHREALALAYILLLLFLYDTLRYDNADRQKLNMLSFVVLATLIFTHHMTSAVALLFLISLSLTYSIESLSESTPANVYLISALVGVMILIWFWTILEQTPILLVAAIAESMTGTTGTGPSGEIGTISAGSLRIQILLWAEVIAGIVLGMLGLGGIYYGRGDSFDLTFLGIAGLFGILLALTMVGVVFPEEGLGLATRFKTFVYIAALPLAAYTIHTMQKHPQRAISILAIILVIAFAMLSVYRIPPYLYTGEYNGGPRAVITETDAAAVEFLGTEASHMDFGNPIVPKLRGYSILVQDRGGGYAPPSADYSVTRTTPPDSSDCAIYSSGPVVVTKTCSP
ncbi:hypothetical protein GRX01_05380 [Halobaculum sp. WSA2]|uniref:Uncharacterized protein n=1 Tax=Halobaculum saliterrae TaxID=2073113 RepID=A0A6B0SPD5_9EURY|nr:hypothetical protein [Halobaculum saliterrae]MXR40774.1 hypothetical protein [Halobaculum saliterrae]